MNPNLEAPLLPVGLSQIKTKICRPGSVGHEAFGDCYHLSKQPNCSPSICSGLMIWQPRCTADTSSRTRHIILYPSPHLITVPVTQNGGMSPTMPASSMTHVSALAPVPFPQLSLPAHSYCSSTPSPCALGQQVTAY